MTFYGKQLEQPDEPRPLRTFHVVRADNGNPTIVKADWLEICGEHVSFWRGFNEAGSNFLAFHGRVTSVVEIEPEDPDA